MTHREPLSPPPSNALSLDVEEWFQVYNLREVIARNEWADHGSRVVDATRGFLDRIEARGARATFFVLGWIAERNPGLVEEIIRRGHEIASHGYGHELLTELDPESFEADLARTEAILEGITGQRPLGYRAPSFTIRATNLWALDVLQRRGYRYDASLFPVARRRYGLPGVPRRVHLARRDPGRVLWSFPPLTRRVAGLTLPFGGGGYLRLFPAAWTSGAIAAMNRTGWPAMIYLHPWELDPDHPLPPGIPPLRRFLHTVNLHRTAAKLDALLKRFRFTTAIDALETTLARHPELQDESIPEVLQ
jgi:polysaccharide deacetylase family protein (PEP-CTERM system associated)